MKLLDLLEYIDVDKTVLQMGDKLKLRFSQDHTIDDNYDPSEFIKYVSDAVDPSKNQQYSLWILRTYINGGINFSEDLSRTNAALKKFDKTKKQLSIKDIGQIKSLPDLETLVDSVAPQQSRKEQKRQLSNEIKKDTIVVYKGSEGMILIPKTEAASCFWGKGTKWCTSAQNNNMFNNYNNDGSLYIIMPNDGTKWQFHLNSGSLMDFRNVPITEDAFNKKYPWAFQNIKFSEDEQIAAVHHDGSLLRFLINPSEEVQLAAVQHDAYAIKLIDNPSEEVQLAAVQQTGHAISDIIKAGIKPTADVQMAAVKNTGNAMQFIVNAGIKPSEEIQLIAAKYHGFILEYLLRAGIRPTEEVQIVAVTRDGDAITYLIKAGVKPSEAVQLAAVSQDGTTYAIAGISKAGIKPSEAVQLAAVKAHGYSLSYIIEVGITPSEEVQIAAAKNGSGNAILILHNAGITPSEEVQLATVRYSGAQIVYIIGIGIKPSEAVQLAAVQKDGNAIRFIIDTGHIKPSEAVQLAAVKQSTTAMKYILDAGIKPSQALLNANNEY